MACRLDDSQLVILLISSPQPSILTHPCNSSTPGADTEGLLQVQKLFWAAEKGLVSNGLDWFDFFKTIKLSLKMKTMRGLKAGWVGR